MLNEWFVKPRGVAYGVPFMATGISSTGLALPDPNRTRHIRLSVNVASVCGGHSRADRATLPLCQGRLPPRNCVLVTLLPPGPNLLPPGHLPAVYVSPLPHKTASKASNRQRSASLRHRQRPPTKPTIPFLPRQLHPSPRPIPALLDLGSH